MTREPESTGRGLGSVMLLMAAVAALVVVALAFPDMLTAGFWRAHRQASPAKPASAPARVANVPAPPLERLSPPAPAYSPGVNPGLNSEPAANAMPEAAPRPAAPASGRDEGGGPKTMVIGRNGSVKYVDAGSKAGLARGRARTTAARAASMRWRPDRTACCGISISPPGGSRTPNGPRARRRVTMTKTARMTIRAASMRWRPDRTGSWSTSISRPSRRAEGWRPQRPLPTLAASQGRTSGRIRCRIGRAAGARFGRASDPR